MIMRIRSYSELRRFNTFEERFDYLKLNTHLGEVTFGIDRHINQRFYASYEWQRVRDIVILRDNGCDLGIPGYEINVEILIHHVNQVILDDIVHGEPWILDPEYLITTTQRTHNAIHFGQENPYPKVVLSRNPNDTKLW
jgi:hypothetical protein